MRLPRKALLLAATALLAIPITLALGATPGAPTVTTTAATGVTDTGATLNGTVNPNGQQTQYAFQWGPTSGYGHETPLPLASAGSGTTAAPVNAVLSGLAPGSAYHFRIIAISPAGVSVGADQTFSTTGMPPPPSPPPPAASTGSATGVGQAGATLGGTVNPHGQATTYYFEWGTTADYGFETAPVSGGSGSADLPASAVLTGLASSSSYHFRLVAASPGGTALGSDQTFTTTTPPAVATGAATAVDSSSATLNGTVNPQGQSTQYHFEFGTTTAYGLETPPGNAGSSSANVAVSSFIAGLVSNTTYHYRIVGVSAGGTSFGADATLKTTGPPQTPSRIAVLGRMGFVSSNGWIGVVVGCFNGQTRCVGHLTLARRGAVVGQRDFNIAPEGGGFQNLVLSSRGQRLLGRSYRGPVGVQLSVVGTNGQQISQRLTLARWR